MMWNVKEVVFLMWCVGSEVWEENIIFVIWSIVFSVCSFIRMQRKNWTTFYYYLWISRHENRHSFKNVSYGKEVEKTLMEYFEALFYICQRQTEHFLHFIIIQHDTKVFFRVYEKFYVVVVAQFRILIPHHRQKKWEKKVFENAECFGRSWFIYANALFKTDSRQTPPSCGL